MIDTVKWPASEPSFSSGKAFYLPPDEAVWPPRGIHLKSAWRDMWIEDHLNRVYANKKDMLEKGRKLGIKLVPRLGQFKWTHLNLPPETPV